MQLFIARLRITQVPNFNILTAAIPVISYYKILPDYRVREKVFNGQR
ncbi:hypothetical protein CHCC20327_0018 [Bacillus licheniformis]|nr:hypothetical protein CHCC20327_0018 [Bacillus licheniformis]